MHFLISEEYGPEEDEDDDDVDGAVKAEIATVLKSYVEDMSPQQRMILKEAVREKLQEFEEEEEMQNEIEEGAHIFACHLLNAVGVNRNCWLKLPSLERFAKDIHLHKHDKSNIWSYDKCFYQYSDNTPY